jgi:hypothetical protein
MKINTNYLINYFCNFKSLHLLYIKIKFPDKKNLIFLIHSNLICVLKKRVCAEDRTTEVKISMTFVIDTGYQGIQGYSGVMGLTTSRRNQINLFLK